MKATKKPVDEPTNGDRTTTIRIPKELDDMIHAKVEELRSTPGVRVTANSVIVDVLLGKLTLAIGKKR